MGVCLFSWTDCNETNGYELFMAGGWVGGRFLLETLSSPKETKVRINVQTKTFPSSLSDLEV